MHPNKLGEGGAPETSGVNVACSTVLDDDGRREWPAEERRFGVDDEAWFWSRLSGITVLVSLGQS